MSSPHPHIIVNADAIAKAMEKKGVRSVNELARRLGLHRNTLGAYLSGERALPEALEKILTALDLLPGEALTFSQTTRRVPGLSIVDFISELKNRAPETALVLFGSRARNTEKPFSDFDVGIYRKQKISLEEFSRSLAFSREWNESKLSTVQLVNLTAAPKTFLQEIRNDLCFLAGDFRSWIDLLRACGVRVYE